MASDARSAVLGLIRAALGGAPPVARTAIDAQWEALPRTYLRQPSRSREEVLLLLEDRLRDYDAYVERVTRVDVGAAVAARLLARGKPRMLVPAGLAPELLAAGEFTEDRNFTHAELDGFGGVLTMATVAIALTGTIVLQDVAGQGRRAANLIPDYHLCMLAADDVVETVPEAMARLASTARLPTTFVSGPSATADIEMTRIKGVHGPRVLDVLLVDAVREA